MLIKATDPKSKRELEIDVDIPETLEALVELYGEKVVTVCAKERIRTKILNAMRLRMAQGKPSEEIVKLIKEEWRPLQRPKRSKVMVEISSEDIRRELEDL